MKIIAALVLMSFLGVAANAQDNPAADRPSLPAIATPAQPAVVPPPPAMPAVPAQPEKKMTVSELRKNHIDAVAALKKQHIDEITVLKTSLKGKSPTEIRKAVEAKKAEHKAAIKELEKANKTEIAQLKADLPKVMHKPGKAKTAVK